MKTTAAATITSRGQVTLPRAVREVLGDIKSVEFEVVDGIITIRPLADMAGSLSKYARKENLSLNEIRDRVWEEVADAKAR